jgi:hypothetical protein
MDGPHLDYAVLLRRQQVLPFGEPFHQGNQPMLLGVAEKQLLAFELRLDALDTGQRNYQLA